jgi:hypothetical protein
MSVEKSSSSLEKLFHDYSSALGSLDKDHVRDKKFDFDVATNDELQTYIQSNVSLRKKLQFLLTQVGYLRINLFYEYYARLQEAEKNNDLDKALHIMNEYIETIAMPFVVPRMRKSFLDLLFGKTPEATVSLENWKLGYKFWFENRPINNAQEQAGRTKEFNKLKQIFITLFSLSFTYENFPPVLGAEDREYL